MLSAPKKLVINASRGGIVDEVALREAALKGRVTDYVCDVWEGEPLFNDHTLARALLATPHIAGYSLEAKHTATLMLVQALHHWLGLPAPRGPVPQPVRVVLEGDADTAGQVLEQVHPGLQTDRELRRLAGLDAQTKAAGFHTLRHRTRLRREFGYLRLPSELFHRIPELSALGFGSEQGAPISEPGQGQTDENPAQKQTPCAGKPTRGQNRATDHRRAAGTIHPNAIPRGKNPIHPKL